ncbi:MAG: aminoacyl-histidine dipeptidase [Prevotellaceae bacterium]|jgi:dipeptidase D|nr:aminoacyl-histidine dipeptidase [Prevotellaceae bacterium]
MSEIAQLHPEGVFFYFDEICKIPRASKKEGKIAEYLLNFAANRGLLSKHDQAGNILIMKPASAGMESRPTVVLQSHLDMVCEKNNETVHDFDLDPIIPFIDENWIKARGTTLGADCGIGIAATLDLLADDQAQHGPLECLFTVDEESGLTGAKNIESKFFTGKILINLDSEDDGELFIGCAGGIGTQISFVYSKEPVLPQFTAFDISITSLQGGHSGDDINKERGNSIKILSRFLCEASKRHGIRLSRFEGGKLHNAIPREAKAIFVVNQNSSESLKKDFDLFLNDMLDEYKATEPEMELSLLPVETPEYIIDEAIQFELLHVLRSCPSGVLNMSIEMPGLVETSTNLASLNFVNDSVISICTSQRSSVESRKIEASKMIKSLFALTSANVSSSDGYPCWKPKLDSRILEITKSAYFKLFGVEPLVKAVHAGLECGLFSEKYPDLDMISFGPTIKNAHSPSEKLEISTVDKFQKLIREVLLNV